MLSSVFLYRQCHFITKNVLIITNLLMKEILYSKIKARKAFLKNNKGEISMKKLMLILIFAFCLALGMSSLAFAEEIDNNQTEEFYITENTTLEDVVRSTNPEQYAIMPEEIKEKFSKIYIKDCNEISSENAYAMGTSSLPIPLVGIITCSVTDIQSHSFDYASTLSLTLECPYAYLEAVVYDDTTGLVVDSAYDSGFDTDSLSLDDTATGLASLSPYQVVAFGDVIPPEGYYDWTANPTKIVNVYTNR